MVNIREGLGGILGAALEMTGEILHRVGDAVDPVAAEKRTDFGARNRLAEFKARRQLRATEQDLAYRQLPAVVADAACLYLLVGTEEAKTNPQAAQLAYILEQRTILLETEGGVPMDRSARIIQAAMRQAELASRAALRALVNEVGVDRFARDMVEGVLPEEMALNYLESARRNTLRSEISGNFLEIEGK